MDPRTKQCESEVIRIIHIQNIANQMSDIFNDSRHVIKSHILVVNTPARVEVPIHKIIPEELIGNTQPRQKRGRPVGAKYIVPRKWKLIGHAAEVESVPENTPEAVLPHEEVRAPEVAISNTPEAVLPPEVVKAPEVAATKPPKVVC
ncbi:uncharacterized protein LOC141690827 [Apium graveolens]|uniref:uncharacterized protein LOC141690827 n=1 Tax=Apium graveolens TaxID=4045 RepID=UPI003D7A1D24